MSASNNIFTGVWINQEKGHFLGSTITVTPNNGLLLVALLALFVSLSGTHSWNILAFFVHQMRVSRSPQHGIHYQQQAILRNTGGVGSSLWQLGKIAWAWRSQRVRSFRRSIWLILLGIIQLGLFSAASIFTSRLARVSDEVLTRSPYCGIWSPALSDNLTIEADSGVFVREQTARASSYVQQCLTEYQTSPECDIFKVQQLAFTTTTNSSCPFQPQMCTAPGGLAVSFDTGLLDSRADLGFNGEQTDRIQYRKVTTCSPISSDGYMTSGTSELNGRGYNYTAAFYGTGYDLASLRKSYGGIPNATYIHSDFKALELGFDVNLADNPYILASVAGSASTNFGIDPIPEIFNPNGNTVLMFASFAGMYTSPSDDPWLSAHKATNYTYSVLTKQSNATFYEFDTTVSPLACVEQHQVCNPSRPKSSASRCTPLTSYDNMNYTGILDTKHQTTVADIIFYAVYGAELFNLVPILPQPLLAMNQLSHSISKAIPSNQWILEASNWFAVGMNHFQRSVSAVATGPPGFEHYTLHGSANDTEMEWFCDNYIMRSKVYTSFSTLALSLVIGFGCAVICCNLWLESIVTWIQNRTHWKRGYQRQVSWKLDSVLQLQRMAYEEAGLGTWENCTRYVPTTAKGEKIQVANEWDELHPTIKGKAPLLPVAIQPDEKKVQHVDCAEVLTESSTRSDSPEPRSPIVPPTSK